MTLADASGQPLDLGADFDQFDEIAWPTHFESLGELSSKDRERRAFRRVLYWTMVDAGFAPYPWEYWHFEVGTRRAAAHRGETTASYGPALPFEADQHEREEVR